jgi:hypothetical protein
MAARTSRRARHLGDAGRERRPEHGLVRDHGSNLRDRVFRAVHGDVSPNPRNFRMPVNFPVFDAWQGSLEGRNPTAADPNSATSIFRFWAEVRKVGAENRRKSAHGNFGGLGLHPRTADLRLRAAAGRGRRARLNVEDLDFGRPGFLIITIRKSKTDQGGAGQFVAVPRIDNGPCAVAALEAWLKMPNAPKRSKFCRAIFPSVKNV